jgi:hypothetical protein
MGDLSKVQTTELVSKVAGINVDTFQTKQPLDLPAPNLRQFTVPLVVATFTPDLSQGAMQLIAGTAAALTIANPIGTPPGDSSGFEMVLAIINTTGGALGAITLGAQYRTAGAVVAPATGNRRYIRFANVGTQAAPVWSETARSPADVPN